MSDSLASSFYNMKSPLETTWQSTATGRRRSSVASGRMGSADVGKGAGRGGKGGIGGRGGKSGDLSWTKDWLDAYVQEGAAAPPRYKDLIGHCERRVAEVEEATAGLPSPNPLLTAVCCDVLDKVSATMGRHRALVSRLKRHIFSSIYGPEGGRHGADLMGLEPYYARVGECEARAAELESLCADLDQRASEERRAADDARAGVDAVREEGEAKAQRQHGRAELLQVKVEKMAVEARQGESDREALERRIEKLKGDVEAEKAAVDTVREEFEAKLHFAQQVVGRHVPKSEVEVARARAKRLEGEVEELRRELRASREDLTPRPCFFRAAEHVPLKDAKGERLSSRDVTDKLCEAVHRACVRHERIEARLSRPFVRLHHSQIDRFAFEEPSIDACIQCLFISHCSPRLKPAWRDASTRPVALSRLRIGESRYESFLKEEGVSPKMELTKAMVVFRDAGSGAPVQELSYKEFRVSLAMLACLLFGDAHHTHEDVRAVVSRFAGAMFGEGEGLEGYLDRLEQKEVARAERAEKAREALKRQNQGLSDW